MELPLKNIRIFYCPRMWWPGQLWVGFIMPMLHLCIVNCTGLELPLGCSLHGMGHVNLRDCLTPIVSNHGINSGRMGVLQFPSIKDLVRPNKQTFSIAITNPLEQVKLAVNLITFYKALKAWLFHGHGGQEHTWRHIIGILYLSNHLVVLILFYYVYCVFLNVVCYLKSH